jgi:hypothetical protein
MEPKDRRKVDDFILYGMAAATQAVRDSRLGAGHRRGPRAHRGDDRLGHRRAEQTIAETAVLIKEKGPKRVSPFFIPGSADQPGLGAGLDQVRLQGAEPCGGDGLFHRRPCHRRCGAADHAGRCRRDGGGRRGKPDLRNRHRRVQRLQGAVDQARATSRKKPAVPMTPTATALSWARAPAWWCWRNTNMRKRARREDLCRGAGLWPVGRRLSHHRAQPRMATAGSGRCRRR